MAMKREVVVVLPGIMGSVLERKGQLVWPGELKDLIFGYRRLNDLMSDDLVPTGVIRSVSISRQYAALFETLEQFGFREQDGSLVPFAYDWRRSNIVSAAALAHRLDQLPGDVDIILLGHSMGGLVARHYLESGRFNARRAFQQVKALITLGTPHRGAPAALRAILGLDRKVFLSGRQVAQVAADSRFPAVYELLPPPGEPCFWDATSGARLRPLDIYSAQIAGQLKLSRTNLESALAFHATLDVARRPEPVRYFFFAGTRMTTITGLSLDGGSGRSLVTHETKDGGDGTVPLWSAALTGVQSALVGGEHGGIYKNQQLRRVLGCLLGHPGTLAVVQAAEVWVHNKVVEPSAAIRATVSVESGLAELNGVLRLTGATGARPVIKTWEVGAPDRFTEQLDLLLEAPPTPGAYRIEYVAADGRCLGEDDFFVQVPFE
jgi:pimeloyl-ACP methyl ester carboxylesterase